MKTYEKFELKFENEFIIFLLISTFYFKFFRIKLNSSKNSIMGRTRNELDGHRVFGEM
jgi:hypothetical protein